MCSISYLNVQQSYLTDEYNYDKCVRLDTLTLKTLGHENHAKAITYTLLRLHLPGLPAQVLSNLRDAELHRFKKYYGHQSENTYRNSRFKNINVP